MATLEGLLLILLIILGFMVIRFRDILSSVIALSVLSAVLALLYLIHQAPDVALAEVAIGAGLTTAIFIVVVSKVRNYVKKDRDQP